MPSSLNKIKGCFETDHLDPIQKNICCNGGTERPFTGQYWDCNKDGIYGCVVCKVDLFSSETKFDSGTGWPSFFKTIAVNAISINIDDTHGMIREETLCGKCGSHLGHRFSDGPQPTGLRYCINSASLIFREEKF